MKGMMIAIGSPRPIGTPKENGSTSSAPPAKSQPKPAPQEHSEVTPEMLSYHGAGEACRNCIYFTPPETCAILVGFPVEESGWCHAFTAGDGEESPQHERAEGEKPMQMGGMGKMNKMEKM